MTGVQTCALPILLPLAFIIVGQLFSFEQRAKMQGLFSGVWGVSSVIGPLIGGFIVDKISWQWVFYINVIPGVVACALVWLAWREPARAEKAKVQIDYLGALLLTVGAVLLLLGLNELGSPFGLGMLALSLALFAVLIWVERRAPDPILPLKLFRERVFTVTVLPPPRLTTRSVPLWLCVTSVGLKSPRSSVSDWSPVEMTSVPVAAPGA